MADESGEVTFDPDDRDLAQLSVGLPLVRAITGIWYRARLRHIERVPDEPIMVIANHSGAPVSVDAPIFATEFARRFGVERPLYLLTADSTIKTPLGPLLRKWGLIPASRANIDHALSEGMSVMVFPGGDYDAARPTTARNTIDFGGRKGFIRSALANGVRIVPVVYIGAHETQLYLTRGEKMAKALRLDKVARVKILPIQFGFPFGLSLGGVLPLNLPLPSKIVGEVLDPIDPAELGGEDEVDAIYDEVVARMQEVLDRLAEERRFPVIG